MVANAAFLVSWYSSSKLPSCNTATLQIVCHQLEISYGCSVVKQLLVIENNDGF